MPPEDDTAEVYRRQGFGGGIGAVAPYALLLVDFCVAFVDPALLGGGNIATAASHAAELLRWARTAGWAIAHSQIVYREDGTDANVWLHKIPALQTLTVGNPAAEFVEELSPVPGELVIRKTVPSAFFGSSLASWLVHRGIKTLVIAGCTTSGCVRASTIDALSYGFRPVLVSDCIGDRSLDAHRASLLDLEAKYASVLDSATLVTGPSSDPLRDSATRK
ncbi:isochorismatase family protein [Mycobacterium sherrisii]|uniref:N-carbamoylsarcosine amidase n=2 Tax=Mycobacterium sherrisii TaxID=243061 RepID=A0A1E3SF58_9MYCO|nr:isochorismatase family protein [Mycobacterium sherrisii]MCV7031157.1 isochorismatase family protein [Mycobacterium sherrisii]ODR00760.1 N-carbamoylsarcosine amidase [Mycobacterium sherrisii]ORW83217.1 N-carbamoylsarcosine amidase [Mycobacterium sherrisii]